jgi:zinc transporter
VALIERVRLLQEEVAAVVNEQTNRTLFVLTVVTVAALPMTIIPGLFGMNVGGVPLQGHAGGFWMLTMLMTVLSTAAAAVALKRRIDS